MSMTIIERFLDDHRRFRRHLEETLGFAATLAPRGLPPPITDADRDFIFRLRRHARMEGEILFPAMQRASDENARKKTVHHFIAHGHDEHTSVAKRHAELTARSETGSRISQWKSALAHFAEGLQRHMDREEREIFPLAQDFMSQTLLTELNLKAESIQ